MPTFYFTFFLLCFPMLVQADEPASIRYLERDGVIETMATGAATPQTPFAIASVGKTLTAVAILRLAERGALELDDPVSRWVDPDISTGFGGLEGITLRHLLTMTSGLPDYFDDDFLEDALAAPNAVQNPKTALTYAFPHDRLFAQGTGFDYSNTNYVLLGLVLEQASGRSYAQAMQFDVLTPAKMRDSFVFGSTPLPANFPNGHEYGQHFRSYYEATGFGDGGIISTAADVARFYKALFIEQTLLTPAMMAEFTQDAMDKDYGMGIEIEDSTYGHSGGDLGFSADARIDLETGTIAVILIAQADADTSWTYDILD